MHKNKIVVYIFEYPILILRAPSKNLCPIWFTQKKRIQLFQINRFIDIIHRYHYIYVIAVCVPNIRHNVPNYGNNSNTGEKKLMFLKLWQ